MSSSRGPAYAGSAPAAKSFANRNLNVNVPKPVVPMSRPIVNGSKVVLQGDAKKVGRLRTQQSSLVVPLPINTLPGRSRPLESTGTGVWGTTPGGASGGSGSSSSSSSSSSAAIPPPAPSAGGGLQPQSQQQVSSVSSVTGSNAGAAVPLAPALAPAQQSAHASSDLQESSAPPSSSGFQIRMGQKWADLDSDDEDKRYNKPAAPVDSGFENPAVDSLGVQNSRSSESNNSFRDRDHGGPQNQSQSQQRPFGYNNSNYGGGGGGRPYNNTGYGGENGYRPRTYSGEDRFREGGDRGYHGDSSRGGGQQFGYNNDGQGRRPPYQNQQQGGSYNQYHQSERYGGYNNNNSNYNDSSNSNGFRRFEGRFEGRFGGPNPQQQPSGFGGQGGPSGPSAGWSQSQHQQGGPYRGFSGNRDGGPVRHGGGGYGAQTHSQNHTQPAPMKEVDIETQLMEQAIREREQLEQEQRRQAAIAANAGNRDVDDETSGAKLDQHHDGSAADIERAPTTHVSRNQGGVEVASFGRGFSGNNGHGNNNNSNAQQYDWQKRDVTRSRLDTLGVSRFMTPDAREEELARELDSQLEPERIPRGTLYRPSQPIQQQQQQQQPPQSHSQPQQQEADPYHHPQQQQSWSRMKTQPAAQQPFSARSAYNNGAAANSGSSSNNNINNNSNRVEPAALSAGILKDLDLPTFGLDFSHGGGVQVGGGDQKQPAFSRLFGHTGGSQNHHAAKDTVGSEFNGLVGGLGLSLDPLMDANRQPSQNNPERRPRLFDPKTSSYVDAQAVVSADHNNSHHNHNNNNNHNNNHNNSSSSKPAPGSWRKGLMSGETSTTSTTLQQPQQSSRGGALDDNQQHSSGWQRRTAAGVDHGITEVSAVPLAPTTLLQRPRLDSDPTAAHQQRAGSTATSTTPNDTTAPVPTVAAAPVVSEQEERKAARLAERLKRGPRTKGVLFRYSSDGSGAIEQVLDSDGDRKKGGHNNNSKNPDNTDAVADTNQRQSLLTSASPVAVPPITTIVDASAALPPPTTTTTTSEVVVPASPKLPAWKVGRSAIASMIVNSMLPEDAEIVVEPSVVNGGVLETVVDLSASATTSPGPTPTNRERGPSGKSFFKSGPDRDGRERRDGRADRDGRVDRDDRVDRDSRDTAPRRERPVSSKFAGSSREESNTEKPTKFTLRDARATRERTGPAALSEIAVAVEVPSVDSKPPMVKYEREKPVRKPRVSVHSVVAEGAEHVVGAATWVRASRLTREVGQQQDETNKSARSTKSIPKAKYRDHGLKESVENGGIEGLEAVSAEEPAAALSSKSRRVKPIRARNSGENEDSIPADTEAAGSVAVVASSRPQSSRLRAPPGAKRTSSGPKRGPPAVAPALST